MSINHYGLVLYEGERTKLLELCVKEGIEITFPDLFDESQPMKYLWGFSINGIGGIGTHVMRAYTKDGVKIIYGVKSLKKFFKSEEWQEQKKQRIVETPHDLLTKWCGVIASMEDMLKLCHQFRIPISSEMKRNVFNNPKANYHAWLISHDGVKAARISDIAGKIVFRIQTLRLYLLEQAIKDSRLCIWKSKDYKTFKLLTNELRKSGVVIYQINKAVFDSAFAFYTCNNQLLSLASEFGVKCVVSYCGYIQYLTKDLFNDLRDINKGKYKQDIINYHGEGGSK